MQVEPPALQAGLIVFKDLADPSVRRRTSFPQRGRVKTWYGVRGGDKAGIYESWDDAKMACSRKGARAKGFKTEEEARLFAFEGVDPVASWRPSPPTGHHVVWTDGSRNQTLDSIGWACYWGPGDPRNRSGCVPAWKCAPHGCTSPRAELMAVWGALQAGQDGGPIHVVTDCTYAIKVMQTFGAVQELRILADPETLPPHHDLIREIRKLMRTYPEGGVTVEKVAAHRGIPENCIVDAMAKAASKLVTFRQ
jgi:ribonuclease HI